MTEKFAIISDIHGNLPALVKVLEDIKSRGIDQFIIAGDYCLSGAWPNDCIQTLKEIPKKWIIQGNEERYLENLIGKDQSLWTDGQMQISYWSYRNVSADNLDFEVVNGELKEKCDKNLPVNTSIYPILFSDMSRKFHFSV